MTRFLPLVDQRLNFTVEHLAFLLAKDIQHSVEAIDQRQQLALVVRLHLFARERCVHFA